jgi:dTDP-4-amino-4,6-dideoxygalactose transaminase
MQVPFVDFKPQYQELKNEIDTGINQVLENGNFILGQEEKDFEQQFAEFCSVPLAVGVNSGTDALHLALKALDVGPGDEVIVPTYTFIATALAVSYTGATPVFVDIDPQTYNIDPIKIKEAVTSKTKALIPVHLYGQPADMDEILSIAQTYGLKVIEDCAQAHGALYKIKRVGSMGDIGCFSFYPTKGLGACGDGGMIVTKDQDVFKRLLQWRDYGRQGRYEHVMKGYNSRLDTLQAVVLSAKLRRLDQWNLMRRKAVSLYCKCLKEAKGITLPFVRPDRDHVYQTFAILLDLQRDVVYRRMQEKGVGVLIHYPIPIHLQQAYAELGYQQGSLPVAEATCEKILSLPMFPHIDQHQIQYVCDVLRDVIKEA